jgi:putative flippase GtrA
MIAKTSKSMSSKKSFIWFAVAGVAGFLVDSGVLLLLKPVLGWYAGRGCSFILAVLTTWWLNRSFAFKERSSNLSLHSELARYFVLMLLGGVCNLAVYGWLISVSEFCQTYPVLAVAVGSLVGMVANYVSTRFGVFRHRVG